MKCRACGHEERVGEEFLQIQVLGAAPMAGILESLAIVSEKGVRHHVDLYACPACGTVRLEKAHPFDQDH
jgi:predicted RNA-binding Zn-ribbon protein involved in translation (DUF1610 family)